MARLSYIFYSGCALGVILFASSCASGNTSAIDGGVNLVEGGIKKGDSAGAIDPVTLTCKNNKKEGAEVCDGTDLGGATCASLSSNQKTGTLGCSADCKNFDETMCRDQGAGGSGTSGTSGSLDATVAGDGGGYSR
jgi:hypothetical protein